jgi:hypothetical protein
MIGEARSSLEHRPGSIPGLLPTISKQLEGSSMEISVRDTIDNPEDLPKANLSSEWCECKDGEFLCYPEDGVCSCGIHKHHVHCLCGKVSQIG